MSESLPRMPRAWLFVLTALCLLSGDVAAQATSTVTGVVTDSRTGEPLRAVEVRDLETRQVALTDRSGRYSLTALPPGTHTIEFTWLGYSRHDRVIEVPGSGVVTFDLSMEINPVLLDEIVVTTASRQPERVLESPAAVVSIPPARVRDFAPAGQAPLLIKELPRVHVMQSGITSFNVNVGGFNGLLGRRLLVLVDGRDVSTPIVGTPEWSDLSIAHETTRMELVRGPNSALYGANAYAGVLNIITPSVRQDAGTRLTVSGGHPTAMSAYGRYAGVSADLRWGYSVAGGYSASDSWDVSRTDVGDLAEEYADAVSSPPGGQVPAPGYELFPLAGQSKATPIGVPGPVTGSPDPITHAHGSLRVDRYLSNGGVLTAEGGFSRGTNQVGATGASRAQAEYSDRPWGRLAWTQDDLSVMAAYTARGGKQLDLAGGTRFEDWSSRLQVEAQTTRRFATDRGAFVLGGSVRSESVDTEGTLLATEHDGRRDEYYAIFGQVGFDVLAPLRLIVAGRLDDASLFEPTFSPKAALVWTASEGHALRVTYGRAYLMPSTAQRFVRFPVGPPLDLSALEAGLRASPLGPALAGVPDGELLGTSAAVPLLAIGNQTLDPERVVSPELGYKGQFARVSVTADIHRSEFDDFWTDILPGVHPDYGPWVAPAAVPDVARDAVETAVRGAVPGITNLEGEQAGVVLASTEAGHATEWGIDVGASIALGDAFRVDGGYSFLKIDFEEGSYLGADSVAANVPSHSGTVAFSYSSDTQGSVRVGFRMDSAFDFRSGVWDGEVPSSQTVDVGGTYPITEQIRFGATVTNLFDQRRFHYFGGSVVGRRLIASLTWEP